MKLYTRILFLIPFILLISCPVEGTNNKRDYTEGLKIVTDIEGGNVYNVRRLSENHFSIQMRPDKPSDHKYPNHMFYWFYLKLVGAKDQTVTIDITNCKWMPSHWNNYKPVYTYSADPNDLTDHKWQKITNTKRFGRTFSFTHTFISDTAYIALRYPYTYTYLKNYLKTIETNPYISVEVLGKTREGRNIYAVMLTDKAYPDKNKKGIWLIAKEHASEQDGAWVIEGMIKYLLSDDPKAISLRRNTIFVFIPLAAPDATYYGRTVNPVTGFDVSRRYSMAHIFKDRPPGMTKETKAILKRLKTFVEGGRSLDIAATLHNPHGSEQNVWVSYNNQYKVLEHKAFNRIFMKHLGKYTRKTTLSSYPLHKFIFIGRCKLEYGSIGFLYEINQHAKGSFLSIDDLHKIGEAFAKGVFDYFKLSPVL